MSVILKCVISLAILCPANNGKRVASTIVNAILGQNTLPKKRKGEIFIRNYMHYVTWPHEAKTYMNIILIVVLLCVHLSHQCLIHALYDINIALNRAIITVYYFGGKNRFRDKST